MIARVGRVISVVGAAGAVVATAWWYSFFHEILGDDFQVARDCFYWTSDLCSLGHAAALFVDVPEYDPMFLWFSVGLFVAGLIIWVAGGTRD